MAPHRHGVSVTRITPVIGAIVDGLDLSRPLDKGAAGFIEEALIRHQVLFFPSQTLSVEQHRDFALHFGALHTHPIYPGTDTVPEIMVLDTHPANPPDNDHWHTDVTFIDTPPLGSILYARKIPPLGGDTLWSNAVAAYEALSPSLQRFLDGLTATHDFEQAFPAQRFRFHGYQERWVKARESNPPVVHPVVRVHPVSGAPALFVNENFTTRINELTPEESRRILDYLFAHITRPEFTLRWRWQEGTVAFWDNRCTQHYAVADYLPERRVMHRATILGDKPQGADGARSRQWAMA